MYVSYSSSKQFTALVAVALVVIAITLPLLIGYVDVLRKRESGSAPSITTVTVTQTLPITSVTPMPTGVGSEEAYGKILEILENSRKIHKEMQQLSMIGAYRYVYALPVTLVATPAPTPAIGEALAKGSTEVSRTNVQVEGVDELDIVKNSESVIAIALKNKVYLFDALENRVSSVINFGESPPLELRGLYLYSSKLVVVASTPAISIMPILVGGVAVPERGSEVTSVYVFDISNTSNPVLLLNVSVSGLYLDSRLVNRYAYFITSMSIYRGEDYKYALPTVNGRVLDASKIIPVDTTPTTYTTVLAMDLEALSYNAVSYMTGYSSRIYMSKSNRLYIASPATSTQELYLNAIVKLIELSLEYLPQDMASSVRECLRNGSYSKAYDTVVKYLSALGYDKTKAVIEDINSKLSKLKQWYVDETRFYVYTINGTGIRYRGFFTANGSLLDQFCMEELSEDFFIVATTSTEHVIKYEVWKFEVAPPPGREITITVCSESKCTITTIPVEVERDTKAVSVAVAPIISAPSTSNNVYVIDLRSLSVASKLQGLAEGERIYAARLVKNIFFLVTFRHVDPLYAIDISNPLNPKVLGYLKIPGFSEYLHPLPGDRLLGIGMENGALKISLFNVTDPTKMGEVASIKISNTWSQALQDHHAVTVHLRRSLAIIPVHMGYGIKQGFLIISYTPTRLEIDQIIYQQNPLRAVYIGSKLFTISIDTIKIYNMDSRSLEGEVPLS
jgi:uncharacterized secreted protein with C-terminal beta-propeller domain